MTAPDPTAGPQDRATLARVPAPAVFVVSGLTQYGGAALAVALFTVLAAPAVAWARILVSAVVLVLWRRPWRRWWTRRELVAAAAFGTCLAGMNITFYIAIDHLPLGTAVAIEFLGPVAVGAVTGRSWRERAAVVVAAVGVALLAGVTLQVGGPGRTVGLVAILAAAAFWAGYIVLGRRVAVGGDGVTTLGLAMVAGALVTAPVLLAPTVAAVVASPGLVPALVGVAVLSSVVPYALEQVVLRRVGPARFSVLLALLPATATVVGAVLLAQSPTLLEGLGLVLVSGAIALTSARRRPAVADPAVTP